MAPPRRRSCYNCVKAKRRCDAAIPRCERCTSKDFVCDYTGSANFTSSTPGLDHDQTTTSPAEPDWLSRDYLDDFGDASMTVPNLEKDIAPFAEPSWLMTMDGVQLDTPNDLAPYISEPRHLTAAMSNIEGCVDTASFFEHGDDYVTTGAIYQARVAFASQQFKTYPEMFYKRGQTPFIHRHLYADHIPPVIQDVLSSCALYSGKNKENESLVFGDISRKAGQLVDMHRSFLLPVDLLASTQALLLYQIIRLLDGDIRQRADAEANEAILVSWTKQLLGRTRLLGRSNDSESSSSTDGSIVVRSWNDWIFEESCRRTVLASYMLQGTYQFLKLGWDNVAGVVDKLSFTAQATLWNAPSEFHWRESYKDKRHFKVVINDWDTDMDGAKPADLDELGVLMFAIYKGMDNTSEWLGRENLSRYGLEWGTPTIGDST